MLAKKACRGSGEVKRTSGYMEGTNQRRVIAPTDYICAISDIGRARGHNEDTFYISNTGRLFMVADGMGGHNAGEVASSLAVEAVANFFESQSERILGSADELKESLLLQAFENAQQTVLAGQKQEGCQGMGSTLILAYVRGDQLYTCHVGDVRCYIRTAAGLQQITRDHSVVGALVQAGEVTSNEARFHPRKNEILQAIGLPSGIVPEVNSIVLKNGDHVLLCSDGLWEALSDEEICSILNCEGSMRQRATQLVDRANEAGGRDNITVILYEHAG
jgi:protein phosphatase